MSLFAVMGIVAVSDFYLTIWGGALTDGEKSVIPDLSQPLYHNVMQLCVVAVN